MSNIGACISSINLEGRICSLRGIALDTYLGRLELNTQPAMPEYRRQYLAVFGSNSHRGGRPRLPACLPGQRVGWCQLVHICLPGLQLRIGLPQLASDCPRAEYLLTGGWARAVLEVDRPNPQRAVAGAALFATAMPASVAGGGARRTALCGDGTTGLPETGRAGRAAAIAGSRRACGATLRGPGVCSRVVPRPQLPLLTNPPPPPGARPPLYKL